MPRDEWLRMSKFDRRYCCPWCPREESIPSLIEDHKKRCPDRPSEENDVGANEKREAALGPVRTPAEWQKRTGIHVLDPDGWRELGVAWETPITEAEFRERASISTTRFENDAFFAAPPSSATDYTAEVIP